MVKFRDWGLRTRAFTSSSTLLVRTMFVATGRAKATFSSKNFVVHSVRPLMPCMLQLLLCFCTSLLTLVDDHVLHAVISKSLRVILIAHCRRDGCVAGIKVPLASTKSVTSTPISPGFVASIRGCALLKVAALTQSDTGIPNF